MSRKLDHPLDLEGARHLRKAMSTVSGSSLGDVWRSAPAGRRLETVFRFLRLRFGPGKLSSGEFLSFGFHDNPLPMPQMRRFAGKRVQQAMHAACNDWTWYAATKHKLLFETILRGAGLPHPLTRAFYDRRGRGFGCELISSLSGLEAWLSDPGNLPVFCKPTTGLLSIGSFRIDAIRNNRLMVNGDHAYSPEEVAAFMHDLSNKGYLLQQVLKPHRKLARRFSDAIASVRFVVLMIDDVPVLHSSAMKIPAGGEVADNFWRTGSVLCSIDGETGCVERAVKNTDDGRRQVDQDHGFGILGLQLPDYAAARDLVMKAARQFPAVTTQSWDIALTDQGPVILELNYGGDLHLSQIASGSGVLTPQFCSHVRAQGYSGLLPD